MPISLNIIVEGDSLEHALSLLVMGQFSASVAPLPAASPAPTATAIPAPVTPAPPVAAPATPIIPTGTVVTLPTTATPVQTAPPPVVPVTPPTYTLDDLMRAATTLMDAGRMAELQQLLSGFGVVSMNALPQEQYGAFAGKLRELGAQI